MKVNYGRWTAGGSLPRLARKIPDRICRDIGRKHPRLFYGQRIVEQTEAALLIRRLVQNDEPMAIARLGATEQAVLARYLAFESGTRFGTALSGLARKYPQHISVDISQLSGVNPPTEQVLDDFCKLYLDCLTDVDVLGCWFHLAEQHLVRSKIVAGRLVPLIALDPLANEHPWTIALRGLRVCVVHPFAQTIERQYERRSHLFMNPNILPEFDLVTVQAVQALGSLPTEFKSWFHALDWMNEKVVASGADVVLVGAGAFGLPIAVAAKRSGMRAVHVGGALQLLFGIIGRRWEKLPYVTSHPISQWTRPADDERPASAEQVEGACYW